MTIHECKEHGAGPCLNENLIGEIAEANATLANRIAALEAQVEAAHRAIDSIGLSRCADAHAGVYPDGRITCDDGRPPLSLVDRVEWLIRWLSDDPYPMGPRIKALEAENAALKAERDEALDTLCNTIDQACDSRLYAAGSAFPGSTHDSMALTAYAEAMFLLERHNRFVIEGDFGRRVIGHFVEVKP